MKSFLIFLFFCSILLVNCNEEYYDIISPSTDSRTPFEINFFQYSNNHYFIDTIYSDTSAEYNLYNRYHGNIIPSVSFKHFVKEIEAYISVSTISESINSIIACAYLNLPSRSYTSLYSDSLRTNRSSTPGYSEVTRFRRLNKGEDFIFNSKTGHINFRFPIKDQDVIAVAYRIQNTNPEDYDDISFGEFMSDLVNNSKSVGVLKLIKPAWLQPSFGKAWDLKMKNIYQIALMVNPITDLDLDIYLKKPDNSEINAINNIKFLELFGFDKYDVNGNLGVDGKFDHRVGISFEPETSEIIFPVIQPFGNNIPAQLAHLKYQAIYDSLITYLTLPENSFIIRGKYKSL